MRFEEIPADTLQLGRLGPRWAAYAGIVAAVGWVGTALLFGGVGAERFYRSYLVSYAFLLSLALGGLFFVLVTHLARAAWSVALRRIAEVVSLTLLPLVVLAVPILIGRHELYEWTHPEAVAADPLLQHKSPYLNSGFFAIRLAIYFVIWIALAYFFAGRSRAQDSSGDERVTLGMERLAAPGTILFAVTVTLVSIDLLMSLYPHWYSTIFGVYYFAGSAVGVFSLVALLVFVLQRAGKLTVVTPAHYHDVGKLMFAFVVFWAYIAFSQYMLIWYGNIPEETAWYLIRQSGPWATLSLVLLFGHFFVPLLWLMSQHVKRRRAVLSAGAVWLLAIHWFDLYWLVMPEFSPDRLPFHWIDVTVLAGLGGLFFAVIFWGLSRSALIPVGDPRLEESLGLEHV